MYAIIIEIGTSLEIVWYDLHQPWDACKVINSLRPSDAYMRQ